MNFLNHIVLEYAALSSAKELSMHGTTYLLALIQYHVKRSMNCVDF